jgi:hypothetical protein
MAGIRGKVAHENLDGVVLRRSERDVAGGIVENGRRCGSWTTGTAVFGVGEVEQPVVAINSPDCIRRAGAKYGVEEFNFFVPVVVWTRLSFGEHKGLVGIEAAVD